MTGTVTGLFTHKSVPVIFEPPCICSTGLLHPFPRYPRKGASDLNIKEIFLNKSTFQNMVPCP